MLSQQQPANSPFVPQYDNYRRLMAVAAQQVAAKKCELAIESYTNIASQEEFQFIPDTYLARAQACYALGLYSNAINDCEVVNHLDPKVIGVYQLSATIFNKLNRIDESIQALEKRQKLRKELQRVRAWYYRQLRITLMTHPQHAKLAIPLLQDYDENSTVPPTNYSCEYFHYARAAYSRDDYDLAAYYFEKALLAFPYDFISLFHLVNIAYVQAATIKDQAEQKEKTANCLQQINYLIEEYGYSRAHALRGSHYIKIGKTRNALNDFVEALKKYESEDFGYFNSRQLQIFTALDKGGKRVFHAPAKSLQFKSSEFVIYYEQTADKHFDNKNYPEALLYYSLAIWNADEQLKLTNPQTCHLYTMRAHVHLLMGNIHEANHNLVNAHRYVENKDSFIRACARDTITRLATHLLFKSNKAPRIKPVEHIPYLLYIQAAETFLETDFHEIGLEILKTAITEFPDLPVAYGIRFNFYTERKLTENALEDLSKSLTISPLNRSFLGERMLLNQKLQRHAEVKKDEATLAIATAKQSYFQQWYTTVFTELIKSAPEKISIMTAFLAEEAFYNKQYNLAIFLFNQAIGICQNDFISQTYRGLAYFLSGNTEDATQDLMHCITKYNYVRAYFGMGLIHHSKKDMSTAYIYFLKAFQKCNEADFDLYRTHEDKIIDCASTKPDNSTISPERLFQEGMVLFESGKTRRADILFSSAIWASNNSNSMHQYYFYRSFTQLLLGLTEAANKDVIKAIESANRNKVPEEEIIILKKLFAKYCLTPVANSITQVFNALAFYNLGISIYPTRKLLEERSKIYFENKDFEAATQDNEALIKLKSEDDALLYDTAEIAEKNHKNQATIETVAANNTDEVKTQSRKSKKKQRQKLKKQQKLSASKPDAEAIPTLLADKGPLITEEKIPEAAAELPVTPEPNITISQIEAAFPALQKNNETTAENIAPTKSSLRNQKRNHRRQAARVTEHLEDPSLVITQPVVVTPDTTVVVEVVATTAETETDLSLSITTLTLAQAEEDISSNQSSPLISNEFSASQQNLTRLTSSTAETESESDLDNSPSPRSSLSDSSVSLNELANEKSATVVDNKTQPDTVIEAVDPPQEVQTQVVVTAIQAEYIPTPAASNETPFRRNHSAAFFPQPVLLNTAVLKTYMPQHCDFYQIEHDFINTVMDMEISHHNQFPHLPPCYFEIYIVGGSLTDRVLKKYQENLRSIHNPPAILIDYLNQPMFKRELILDDFDILTTLPRELISQIAAMLGFTPLVRKPSDNQENQGFAPQIDYQSFIKDGIKIDIIHKDSINFAHEAFERDSGLFLNRNGELIEISDYGLMDLIEGEVRLTILPTATYLIEPLKLMHTIHTSTKRHLAIHDREIIKQCAWLTYPIQSSYLNSALRKLFFPGRIVTNYYQLHEFKVFDFLYSRPLIGAMRADDKWIRTQLENSDRQKYVNLQHIHAIFITSFTMLNNIHYLMLLKNTTSCNNNTIGSILQNANILTNCASIIDTTPLFKDVFCQGKPESLIYIFENYINCWKAENQELITNLYYPDPVQPCYDNQSNFMSNPCYSNQPPVYHNYGNHMPVEIIPNQLYPSQPPPYDNHGMRPR